MKNKLGIVQGRLSKSPKNRLQYFPTTNWKKEFEIANNIGFNFIEFFSQRQYSLLNPIWSRKLFKQYLLLAKKNNLIIMNFCDDYIIANDIRDKKTIIYLKKLIINCSKLKIKNLVLPMYEKSNLTDENKELFYNSINLISSFSKKYKIKILIESNILPQSFCEIKKNIKNKNLFFLYDTGNRVQKKDKYLLEILEFGNDIHHVHIKDKNFSNKNVLLGCGEVNFNQVFKFLKKIKYKGHFTLETNKGLNPIETAKIHFRFAQKHIEKL